MREEAQHRATEPGQRVAVDERVAPGAAEITADIVDAAGNDGRIVASGGIELAERLERDGYESFRTDTGATRR